MWSVADNIRVFEDTMNMCRDDPELAESVAGSIKAMEFRYEADAIEPKFNFSETSVRMADMKTVEAAAGCEGRTAILNFADYFIPGGLVKSGAFTQEEAICRVTTLYPCISSKKGMRGYYYPHASCMDSRYSHDLIYIPDVTVIREDREPFDPLDPGKRYRIDVVTCASPNMYPDRMTEEEMYIIHRERCRRIIASASLHNADNLVLGAFGCGAFGNHPEVVAKAMKDAVTDCNGAVKEIIMAIPAGIDSRNYQAFEKVFTDE